MLEVCESLKKGKSDMRVEFYLTGAMQVLHFAPVARALERMGVDAVFVLHRRTGNSLWPGCPDPNAAEELIKRLQLRFVPIPNPNADIAVTTNVTHYLRGYRKLRARMNYGVGLVWYNLSWIRSHYFAGFDLYLVHGPFDLSIPTRYVNPKSVAIIGYPRLDAWFSRPPDPDRVRKENGVAGSKPTILYLPTWQHRSSIDRFADSVFGLSERFEVLIKPHDCTFQMEPERMDKLKSGRVKMLSPYLLPEEAFALADIVISDIDSGAATEAIFLKKHTVCLATTEQVENLLLPEIRQEIPICLAPEELSQKIDEAVAADPGSEGLQKLRRYMFDTSEGADAGRAAQALIECVENNAAMPWSSVRTGLRWRKQYLRYHMARIARRYLLPKRSNRQGG
jgi:CDP-Glycerol:Poly(glycerophosphate) glycerophosphotransferase